MAKVRPAKKLHINGPEPPADAARAGKLPAAIILPQQLPALRLIPAPEVIV